MGPYTAVAMRYYGNITEYKMKVQATSDKIMLIAENEFEKQQLRRLREGVVKNKYFDYIHDDELTIELANNDWGT